MFALSSSCFSENARNETLPFQFTATGYSSELLQNMSRLFTDECLCDVGLVIQPDRLIRAHRCVLSAASPYFHAMLTGGLRESSADVIDMQAVGAPHVIEKLVEFIYTGATGAHLLALISVSVDHILRLVILVIHSTSFRNRLYLSYNLIQSNFFWRSCVHTVYRCLDAGICCTYHT